MIRTPGGINYNNELAGFKESMAVIDAIADLRLVLRDNPNHPLKFAHPTGAEWKSSISLLRGLIIALDLVEVALMGVYTVVGEP